MELVCECLRMMPATVDVYGLLHGLKVVVLPIRSASKHPLAADLKGCRDMHNRNCQSSYFKLICIRCALVPIFLLRRIGSLLMAPRLVRAWDTAA